MMNMTMLKFSRRCPKCREILQLLEMRDIGDGNVKIIYCCKNPACSNREKKFIKILKM